MTNKEERLKVKLESEMRTEEVSEMIGEGGLGADKYYKIKKPAPSEEDTQEKEDKK